MNSRPLRVSVKKGTWRMIAGIFFIFVGLLTLLSFVSYLTNWKVDQSRVGIFDDRAIEVENILGKVGAWLGHTFIYEGIGVMAIGWSLLLLLIGAKIMLVFRRISWLRALLNLLFFSMWVPLLLSFAVQDMPVLGGRFGFEIFDYLNHVIGYLGIGLLLGFSFLIYVLLEWRVTPATMRRKNKSAYEQMLEEEEEIAQSQATNDAGLGVEVPAEEVAPTAKADGAAKPRKRSFASDELSDDEISPYSVEGGSSTAVHTQTTSSTPTAPVELEPESTSNHTQNAHTPKITEVYIEPHAEGEVGMTVEKPAEEEQVEQNLSQQLVSKYGEYDPRLDLSKYKFPHIDLLRDYKDKQNVTVDQNELEANKNKIVDTLSNYGIGIDSIKATIGPTVTLYEIIPEAGVRISKIKNLEDDIALSLSALGIRIIAPIPGKGTIGIEVPNSSPTMVSMRSVIASQKFQTSQMELPIAFGKTISNETFVADLARMPHLLMAGATGQGKSVGLNAIITSLVYKKHPSELKFVMVDPKKVELALYSKIERHFLAKLPDAEDAIITDNQKVINTLNSLTIEMDQRYDLLKNAFVRNIKEYNEKFKQRKLNPEDGHRFMPYIVLVVDEFADLIMTAGKEVEMPIARLAQLARAVGIHLIIATQRPSVNVITGIIKANFPARVAFRVTSKVDSRTILDSGGADQLIGKGDMLFTTGNELVRMQCAFVDTPEVEEIAEFIGGQKGYSTAFLLPEYEGEESGSTLDLDPNERDPLFEDAARIIVAAQQGSTSLLQRKLKIGYNRAGRLIDQLEVNGIVGAFEGTKARDVLVRDEMSLEQLLKNHEP